jgi:hypothetical protein
MRLWIESAHRTLTGPGTPVAGDVIRTGRTHAEFHAVLASHPDDERGSAQGALAVRIAQQTTALLEAHHSPVEAVATVLKDLAQDLYLPFSILQIQADNQAHLVECDAPPLFLTRRGRLVLLPVIEEVAYGRLIRQCRFPVERGDYLAIVSAGFIQAHGWDRRWGWRDIATSIRRLTALRGDAEQLLEELVSVYRRISHGDASRDASVLAMFARPIRTATVWSGPPADPALDERMLQKLMIEDDIRIICGNTTAEIAARELGAKLTLEPRPEDNWEEIPPTFRLDNVDLVTEGLITLTHAQERMVGIERARELSPGIDGATRLARLLLTADQIHFLIGTAVNPAQTTGPAGTIPLRAVAIKNLMADLQARGKIITAEYPDADDL